MNILFLTMSNIKSLSDRGIYEDLMRVFIREGHSVFVVSPAEKRDGQETSIVEKGEHYSLLKVRTGNLQKTSFIKKGIATLKVPNQFTKAIKKHFQGKKFSLILYSTPPITLVNTIKYFKKRDNATTFLLLKDIFPQNAIDIGILHKNRVKGFIYKFFRKKEKKLYTISDHIGCMSKANIDYIAKNNPEVDRNKLTIVPNSIEPLNILLTADDKKAIRDKYGIPQDKIVFVYGGNLGKPQGIPFIIKCLKTQGNNKGAFFLIVGDGTEYGKLEEFLNEAHQENVKLLRRLPKTDFDTMLAACDVGMIFLDYRFTIPNYPSRLLSYMQGGVPVLSCTDKITDVGNDIENGGFGWKCDSDNVESFNMAVNIAMQADRVAMGQCGRRVLSEQFDVADGYKTILSSLQYENIK